IIAQEGMSLDVVSGGELAVAASVNFPPERIHFHGNNKSEQELREAVDYGIARIVVDNFHELQLLNGIAQGRGMRQKILLRLSPGIDPHTHAKTTTGTLENKFGIPLPTGQAEAAVRQAMEMPGLELVGLHVHLGSPVFELEPYGQAVDTVLDFVSKMRKEHGFGSGGRIRRSSTRPSRGSTPRPLRRRCGRLYGGTSCPRRSSSSSRGERSLR